MQSFESSILVKPSRQQPDILSLAVQMRIWSILKAPENHNKNKFEP